MKLVSLSRYRVSGHPVSEKSDRKPLRMKGLVLSLIGMAYMNCEYASSAKRMYVSGPLSMDMRSAYMCWRGLFGWSVRSGDFWTCCMSYLVAIAHVVQDVQYCLMCFAA